MDDFNFINAELNYGYLFDYTEFDINLFPWTLLNLSLNDWWFDTINEFTPSKEIFDLNGNELENITIEDYETHFTEYSDFQELYPLPIKLREYGYELDEGVIVCVPDYNFKVINNGYQCIEDITIDTFKLQEFENFCNLYLKDLIEYKTMNWYLTLNTSYEN